MFVLYTSQLHNFTQSVGCERMHASIDIDFDISSLNLLMIQTLGERTLFTFAVHAYIQICLHHKLATLYELSLVSVRKANAAGGLTQC
jgi:hypothetical protein